MNKTFTCLLLLGLLILPCSASSQDNENLEAMIGEMLLVGFRGLEVDKTSPIIDDIAQGRVGGVILFDYDVARSSFQRNIASPGQLKALTADLQAASKDTLLIAVDQEGGKVSRLKEKYGFPPRPSQARLGKHNHPELTRRHAEQTAAVLAEMGINLNLAPVVDVNVTPDNPVIGGLGRSFSADPDIVVRHAAEVIAAHREHNVLTALKHFPGHGSSTRDSHHGFTDVTDTWTERELQPYTRLFQSPDADMVMTAHVFNARLDPNWPATLSAETLDRLLRREMGFEGVIISDDMQMGAIRDSYSLKTALERTILAGTDLIIFGNNLVYEPDIAQRCIQIISGLVRENRIPASRIQQSYERIRQLKTSLQNGLLTPNRSALLPKVQGALSSEAVTSHFAHSWR
ncbi:glycoside hydrolase family 3 protein [Desulfovermiculus halophilus]|uniref:glycoside hydrolase family 3 protein n=1 Tax=Desulfovermiculus halophilus TaxID=339722 RepID=UPI000A768736|nr:glycoside hydrolase family 3 N-terminal domain-containing protein [Desulfovermiculus halophilus]